MRSRHLPLAPLGRRHRSAIDGPLLATGLAVALLCAGTAFAQGAPPFEINNPGRSGQVTEMELSINGKSWGSGDLSLISDGWVREVRSQAGLVPASGSLSLAPQAALCVGVNCGISIPNGNSSGQFWVIEPAGVTTTGSYAVQNDGPGSAGIEMVRSDGDSGFDLVSGLIDLEARARTADYGGVASSGSQTYPHWVRAVSDASLRDWVYVDGPGPTATIVLAADLSGVSLDAPDSTPPVNATLLDQFWTTQFYGDLRENVNTCDAISDASAHQETRFLLDLEIEDEWFEEEFCEDTDEDGEDDFCYTEWTSNLAGAANATREQEMLLDYQYPVDPCIDEFPVLLPFDTGALPATLTAQATVQTGQWVRVHIQAQAAVLCSGALGCDLTTRSDTPIPLTITSPNGTLVAWNGIAGLQAVPEPGVGLSVLVGAAVLVGRARATRSQRR